MPSPSRSPRRRFLSALPALLCLLALGACSTPTPPKDAPPVNACLPGYRAIDHDSIPSNSSADVILIATLYSTDPSFERFTTGNTVYYWSFNLFNVLAVEKGPNAWPSAGLAFLTLDSARINSNSGTSPYRYGVKVRFWLTTHSAPAHIIGQQFIYQ